MRACAEINGETWPSARWRWVAEISMITGVDPKFSSVSGAWPRHRIPICKNPIGELQGCPLNFSSGRTP